MKGETHLRLGVLAGAVYATVQGSPWLTVAAAGLVAGATSRGSLSPDGDQSEVWRESTRLLPASARAHRGTLHWLGWPLLAWFAVSGLEPQVQWAGRLLIIGWASHLLGDLVFGKPMHGHGPGIPLAPWGAWYVGLGLDTGGRLEDGVTWRGRRILPSPTRLALGLALAWVYLVHPGYLDPVVTWAAAQ